MKKHCKLIPILLAAILILAGCGSPAKEAPLATFENYSVAPETFSYFYGMYRSSMAQQAVWMGYDNTDAASMAEFWAMDMGDNTTLTDYVKGESLYYAKSHTVMYQAALAAGVTASEEATAETETMLKEAMSNAGDDPAAFEETYGAPYELVLSMYQQFDLISAYTQKLQDEATPSEEDVRALYGEDGDMDLVTVRHVLIMCDDTMTEEDQAAAKQQADMVLAALQGGADIAELAAEYSEDEGSKDNSGEYTFGKGEMVEEFEEWAFAAAPGDQGIVKTAYGYHVMEMIERIPVDVQSLYSELEARLKEEMADEIITELLKVTEEEWVINEEVMNGILEKYAPAAGENVEPSPVEAAPDAEAEPESESEAETDESTSK